MLQIKIQTCGSLCRCGRNPREEHSLLFCALFLEGNCSAQAELSVGCVQTVHWGMQHTAGGVVKLLTQTSQGCLTSLFMMSKRRWS